MRPFRLQVGQGNSGESDEMSMDLIGWLERPLAKLQMIRTDRSTEQDQSSEELRSGGKNVLGSNASFKDEIFTSVR